MARLRIAFRSGEQIGEKSRRNLKPKGYFEKLIKQMVFQKSKKAFGYFGFLRKERTKEKNIYNHYLINYIYIPKALDYIRHIVIDYVKRKI